jgi:hypothetical protein
MKVRYVYRSAITGKFVSKEYAEQHRDTTVRHEYEVEDEE